MARARRFIEDNTPYSGMEPADACCPERPDTGWRNAGQTYLVYLPAGGAVGLDLTGVSGNFDVRWFDPRNGGGLKTGSVASITGAHSSPRQTRRTAPVWTGSSWSGLVLPATSPAASDGVDGKLRLATGATAVRV